MGKGSQKDMASVLRVSPQYLNDFLKGRREPGPSILKELGLRREVRYVDI
jgi:transcriptional regulator with XRE-family HTH domain